MPIQIEYTKDGLGVVTSNYGITSYEEMMSTINQIIEDERYSKLKYWIRNTSEAEELAMTFENTKQIAEIEAREFHRNPEILMAIIAETDHTYAMSSIYKAFSHKNTSDINIFQSRELADEWILSRLKYSNKSTDTDFKKPLRH